MIKRLRQYCRCICIWQCCTTFQDFDPDFNTGSLESTPAAITATSSSYFQYVKPSKMILQQPPPPVARASLDVQSETTTTSSNRSKSSSVAMIVNKKVDELESLLSQQ